MPLCGKEMAGPKHDAVSTDNLLLLVLLILLRLDRWWWNNKGGCCVYMYGNLGCRGGVHTTHHVARHVHAHSFAGEEAPIVVHQLVGGWAHKPSACWAVREGFSESAAKMQGMNQSINESIMQSNFCPDILVQADVAAGDA